MSEEGECKMRKKTALEAGGVAQLGEHLPCKQGVSGSIPLISTSDTGMCRKMVVQQEESDHGKTLSEGL